MMVVPFSLLLRLPGTAETSRHWNCASARIVNTHKTILEDL
jgi:hypothetical protein